ncbi:MAG: Uma2 family endonuclease [Bernardetiaceae bacterium]|jgi:Uma2 family endonuclease|nr:Uma2 family endonuclease [Bernardetiaceae bacterium]
MILTQVTPKTYTEADYAKLVERLEQKVEFADGQFVPAHGSEPLPPEVVDYILSDDFAENELTYPFPMATENHDDIISNLFALLVELARHNRSFKVYSQGTQVYIPLTGKTRIPDVLVVEKSRHQRDELHRVLSPQVVVEVLSKSTQAKDKLDKLEEYQSLPSLQQYVLIWQDQPLAVVHTRLGEDLWQQQILKGLDKLIDLNSLDLRLPLAEVYEGVEFAEAEK